ncbi:DUF397 domain-containing protein [Streptomyces sp. NPDC057302]|uniref:DUF397 domain-containing protein n=1 Tax=Streptomyces sp. NPDC057302 TaxID=3346094 RepID=UPI003635CD81
MIRANSLPEMAWRKSSYSSDNGGACIEVADGMASGVPVRDSKAPDGPALVLSDTAWNVFVDWAKS